ncbi:MAG: hypothetical protein V3U98_10045 [Acidobacteriota bacterium]
MITGHNTDIEYRGQVYHVQTEDKGLKNPIIESLIYQKGKILDSKRTSYAELLKDSAREKEIQERLNAQHKRMVLRVRSGKYDPEGPPQFGEGFISKRRLDEVVLEYLRNTKGDERMDVIVQAPPNLLFGKSAEIEIFVRTELTSKPLPGVDISIRLASSANGDVELFRGKTDEEGKVTTSLAIPGSDEASAVLIVEALSRGSREEARMLVRSARPQPVH